MIKRRLSAGKGDGLLDIFYQENLQLPPMLITKESDYAVRILRELVRGGRETTGAICGAEQVPLHYAYKILKKLENAGLVKVYRGAAGGNDLARDPSTISLFDVITAVDDHVLLNECLGHGNDCPMKNRGKRGCGVHAEFARIQELLQKHLKEKALTELF
jgi:Rrf2 family protein